MTADIDTPDAAAADDHALENERALGAVNVGLLMSAIRCVLTYVVAPVLGGAGAFLGVLGLILQVVALGLTVLGLSELYHLRHRWRFAYTALAVALAAWIIIELTTYL